MNREPESESSRWHATHRRYIDEVLEVARSSALHTGERTDHTNRALVVMGVGDPTPELADVMARAPEGLHVVWQAVPYTSVELIAEARRILFEQRGRLNGGGPLADGTGIGFTTTDPSLLDAPDPRTVLGSAYPVVVEHGAPAIPA